MKHYLVKFKEKEGYISAIRTKWYNYILYYPLQIIMALIIFIFSIMPVIGLKCLLVELHHREFTKDIKKMMEKK